MVRRLELSQTERGHFLLHPQHVIAFRRAHPILSKEQFCTDAEIRWFVSRKEPPNWSDPKCKTLACLINEEGQDRLYLMFNAATEETDFGLPPLPFGCRWRLAVDTFGSAPQDFSEAGREAHLDSSTTYRLESRSNAVLQMTDELCRLVRLILSICQRRSS